MVSGYAGNYLDVNLTDRSVKTFPVDVDVARKMVGGLTYGLYLLWNRTKPGTNPMGPENILFFNTGPISGLAGTSRGTVVFKSPLTELMGHSECGGPLDLRAQNGRIRRDSHHWKGRGAELPLRQR